MTTTSTKRSWVRKDSNPYHLLQSLLVAGGVLVISVISPQSGAILVKNLIGRYLKNKKVRKESFLRDLRRLQQRELIEFNQLPDGKVKIVLTKKGKNKILINDIDNLKITKQRWDRKWRLITFDISDDKKPARDALREKIIYMGFYPLQRSVFITPYQCENEIDFICTVFEIERSDVLLLEINTFEGEEKLKHYFKLTS